MIKSKGYFIDRNKIKRVDQISDSIVAIYTEELNYSNDKTFTEFKYQLIKTKKGWTIDDCLRQCVMCKGSGQSSLNKKDPCKYCNGQGWESTSAY